MGDPVQRLSEDHKRLVQVLLRLDRNLQRCQGKDSYQAEVLAQIIEALDYIQGYPERWHHPVEDLAFRRLSAKGVDTHGVVERLLNEHQLLEDQSSDLQARFHHCVKTQTAPDSALLKGAYDYLNRQLRHQKQENDKVFPLLSAALSDDDWRQIEQELLSTPHNMLVRQHYQAVFHRLVQQDSAPEPQPLN